MKIEIKMPGLKKLERDFKQAERDLRRLERQGNTDIKKVEKILKKLK